MVQEAIRSQLQTMALPPRKKVLVVGAGPAGIAAATELTRHGIGITIIDKSSKPGGNVDTGFSPWSNGKQYMALMQQEVTGNSDIEFIPNATFDMRMSPEQARQAGFAAVILATGIQEERKLAVEGIYQFEGRGLTKHYPFRLAFNQFTASGGDWAYFPEKLFDPVFIQQLRDTHDTSGRSEEAWKEQLLSLMDSVVIPGGGRASMEVAKIISAWIVSQKLRMLHKTTISPIDVATFGVGNTLRTYGYSSMKDIGLTGPTILHWKGVEDMTIFSTPELDDDQKKLRLVQASKKVLDKAADHCGVTVFSWTMATGFTTTNGIISGIEVMESEANEYAGIMLKPETKRIIKTHMIIPTLGAISRADTIPADMLKQQGIFLVGTADNAIGGFHGIRRSARKKAQEIASYVLTQ